MRGETLGKRALGLDAVYCAGGGLVAVAAAQPLGRLLDVPSWLVAACGVGALVWAAALAIASRGSRWRATVVSVAVANGVAAATFAGLALVAPALGAQLLLAAVALEVMAFAGAQLLAVHRG